MQSDVKEIKERVNHFRTEMKNAGLKLTHQRMEIFREIAASIDHPDAISIYNSLKDRLPTISIDTVYRTLTTFNDLGLIKMFSAKRECARFDANLNKHHHFICTRCGLVRDFISTELDSLEIPKDVSGFGSVLNTHIEIRGICNDCSRKSG